MPAVFIEGWIFLGLTLLGLRQWLARAIPHTIKVATGVGIGLFLTLIGLTYSEGIGLTVGAVSTPLELAGCSPQNRLEDGTCPGSDKMRNPTMWVGIFCSGFLSVFLMLYRVKGAIVAGYVRHGTKDCQLADTDSGTATALFSSPSSRGLETLPSRISLIRLWAMTPSTFSKRLSTSIRSGTFSRRRSGMSRAPEDSLDLLSSPSFTSIYSTAQERCTVWLASPA